MKKIITYPNPVLRKKTEKVKNVEEVSDLIKEMKKTLHEVDGVGLAAPQVGVSKQLFIIKDGHHFFGFMNPKIIEKSNNEISIKEGCLSFPGFWTEVKRPDKVKIQVLTEDDEEVILEAEGMGAVVFQHEIDHLFGRLFVDDLSSWDRLKLKFTNFRKKKSK